MNVKFLLKNIVGLAFCGLALISQAKSVKDMPLAGINSTASTTFKAYEGNYIYVDFWASWCGPCKKSFPFMVDLQKTYKDKNFKVVAISVDEEKADALEFLAKTPANFDLFHDAKGQIAEEFKLPGMPTSYLIDPTGKIISKHVGFRDSSEKEIKAELDHLFNK